MSYIYSIHVDAKWMSPPNVQIQSSPKSLVQGYYWLCHQQFPISESTYCTLHLLKTWFEAEFFFSCSCSRPIYSFSVVSSCQTLTCCILLPMHIYTISAFVHMALIENAPSSGKQNTVQKVFVGESVLSWPELKPLWSQPFLAKTSSSI